MSGYVVPPGGGRSFGPGISLKVEHGLSPSFAVMESTLPPSWPGPGPHLHRSYDEAVYVLDGTVALEGADDVCPTGSLVYMPSGASHGFANPSDDPARILVVATPDAIRMVEELFQLEPAEHAGVGAGLDHAAADPTAVAAMYVGYDSELVAG
jgi:quercetin dioxygenase-like cupin family protein